MLNRYMISRTDQVMHAVVAAEDEYEARLVAQRTFNRARAGRAWMSDVVSVELMEVCTSDEDAAVITASQWTV